MTTITTICKRCGRTRVTKCVDTFYSTADMWSSACGFFHGITRHWGTLSPESSQMGPVLLRGGAPAPHPGAGLGPAPGNAACGDLARLVAA